MRRFIWLFCAIGVGTLVLGFQNCAKPLKVKLNIPSTSRGNTQNIESLKPNIVFVLVDDMRFADLAFLTKIKANLIDRGTTSASYYATTPLCCPSRASTLRGQFAHNTGVFGNGGSISQGGWQTFHDRGLENSTIATWLQEGGYATALYGKYLNKYRGNFIPPGWNDWAVTMNRPHSPYNYTLYHNGVEEPHGEADADYQTLVLTELTLNFIKSNARIRPFFVYLGLTAPHNPQVAPRTTNTYFNSASYSIPSFIKGPAYNEDVSDKHPWLRAAPPLPPEHEAQIAAWFANRIGSLFAVEESVLKIINILKENGVFENTYIFFVSDNGYHMGDHRMALGKNTGFETDIRVPFVVIGPNVKVGYNVTQFIANIDLAPTWAEIAGVTPPDFVDGMSFLSLISSNLPMPTMWRNDLLFEHWGADSEDAENEGEVAQPTLSGLRSVNYKYIEYEDGSGEFYNLLTDPDELTNEISNTTSPRKLERSQRRLREVKNCTGVACRTLYPLNQE